MESATPVSIKWGSKTYELEIGAGESVEDLRHKLFSLTNVPPDRQKIMVSSSATGALEACLSCFSAPVFSFFSPLSTVLRCACC